MSKDLIKLITKPNLMSSNRGNTKQNKFRVDRLKNNLPSMSYSNCRKVKRKILKEVKEENYLT
jgi:hypothetical protein